LDIKVSYGDFTSLLNILSLKYQKIHSCELDETTLEPIQWQKMSTDLDLPTRGPYSLYSKGLERSDNKQCQFNKERELLHTSIPLIHPT
jgi:hypothetical protein